MTSINQKVNTLWKERGNNEFIDRLELYELISHHATEENHDTIPFSTNETLSAEDTIDSTLLINDYSKALIKHTINALQAIIFQLDKQYEDNKLSLEELMLITDQAEQNIVNILSNQIEIWSEKTRKKEKEVNETESEDELPERETVKVKEHQSPSISEEKVIELTKRLFEFFKIEQHLRSNLEQNEEGEEFQTNWLISEDPNKQAEQPHATGLLDFPIDRHPLSYGVKEFYKIKCCDVYMVRKLATILMFKEGAYTPTIELFDILGEVRDDMEDVQEDLTSINANRFLISLVEKGQEKTKEEYSQFIQEALMILKANIAELESLGLDLPDLEQKLEDLMKKDYADITESAVTDMLKGLESTTETK